MPGTTGRERYCSQDLSLENENENEDEDGARWEGDGGCTSARAGDQETSRGWCGRLERGGEEPKAAREGTERTARYSGELGGYASFGAGRDRTI